MKAALYPRLERAVKQAWLVPLTFLRYGTAHPHRARLQGCENWIYIDPADPCALKKVVHEPLRGKVSSNLLFWRAFNAHLQPELVVDVGVNYGECLFGTNYSPGATIWGFEANPRLLPYLEQSRQHHPDAARIMLTQCLVSDAPAEAAPFLVNPQWSGSSSAVRQLNETHPHLEFRLPARTLDSVIPGAAAEGRTLLFKMDIEGYESRALTGFADTLRRASRAAGFIEFTPQFMRWAGVDPQDFFRCLRAEFAVHCFASVRRRQLLAVRDYRDLPARHGPEFAGTDLMLTTPGLVERGLPSGWSVVN